MTKKIGFVIGNGTSRKGFDLNGLSWLGTTVGCNRIYKDFEPDYLVAIDRHMEDSPCDEIEDYIKSGAPRKWRYITRKYLDDWWWMTEEGSRVEREMMFNRGFCHNSGMFGALYLSQVKKYDTVYLIGIDFFRPDPDGPNDIYGRNFGTSNGLIKVWNHMFNGAPLRLELEKPIVNMIESEFVRVGPVKECDAEFYRDELPSLRCISFDEMFDEIAQCAE